MIYDSRMQVSTLEEHLAVMTHILFWKDLRALNAWSRATQLDNKGAIHQDSGAVLFTSARGCCNDVE